ncbi:PAS domain-containing protein [Thalassobaculum sp. OXR-137]|uniref:PAS domain-containing protein n=1 Tax=Thalassobaculum sp. OXR-137 TaxID=3100173 RepID=UPI002AC8EE95|nr:PAS domain-containing protein [Thalassobaculum sp. OXR-137]WPZ32839.1 PAS domain-containing protein [Thalassobaculum sp. OXR-137]
MQEVMIAQALSGERMQSPIVRDAYAYWAGKRRGCLLPARADIDPVDIPRLLPHVSLVEREAATGRYRYRLFGSALVEILGREPTGKYLDEIYPDFESSESRRYRDQVFEMGKPSHRIGRPSLRFPKDFVSVERLYLPLAEDGRRVNMVMGVLVSSMDTLDD